MRYVWLFCILGLSLGYAAEPDDEDEEEFEETLISKSHTLSIEGERLEYISYAGRLPLYNEEGKESARIFYLAFIKKDGEEGRPLTFVFPGGPGGASCPESICSFGPKRLPLTTEGKPTRPPYTLKDNAETLLFETDLVYVDPVETGFSVLLEEKDARFYRRASGDMLSLAAFISHYLSQFQKWNAPLFLSGCSYGTTRACGVGYLLTAHYGIPVRGLILMGNAIDLGLLDGNRNRYLPDCLLIPTFAATAWYHGRLWPERSLKDVVEYARKFAYDEYSPAMAQPSRLDRNEKEQFFRRLSEMTGLPVSTIQRYNGRIDEEIFTTEFFSSERKILGGLDSRYKGDQSSIKRWRLEEDPSYRPELKGLSSSFLHYLQKEIGIELSPSAYNLYADQPWYFDVSDWFEYLRQALVINPDLQVFSANGYYDCRTPFMASEYCFERLDLPESYHQNLQFEYYEAGHGLIFDAKTLKQMRQHLIEFYRK